ncbi:hypothetical protein, partial [Endozoicomonas sp. SESOKO3]|uniref:hypothetical protein n=1 Tax=Endozoicomonas sp. SESOKO3 TaxID=2828744 RepID=UPI0021484DE5
IQRIFRLPERNALIRSAVSTFFVSILFHFIFYSETNQKQSVMGINRPSDQLQIQLKIALYEKKSFFHS